MTETQKKAVKAFRIKWSTDADYTGNEETPRKTERKLTAEDKDSLSRRARQIEAETKK